jgi:AraC-like DNA-binding protein
MYDVINYSWKIHRAIFDYELIYIEEGEMEVIIQKQVHIAKQGDIVFLKPKVEHQLIKRSEKLIQPHIHFDLFEDDLSETIGISFNCLSEIDKNEFYKFRNDNLEELNLDLPTIIRIPNNYIFNRILSRIIEEFDYPIQSDHKLYLKTLLIELLINLKRGFLASKKENKHLNIPFNVDEFKRFIYDNCDKNISLEQLADHVHLSKFYFIKVFKDIFNATPLVYVNNLKSEKASRLLLNTQLPLSEIANQLSFNSQQAFSRWFKKTFKVSPLEYRKSNKG